MEASVISRWASPPGEAEKTVIHPPLAVRRLRAATSRSRPRYVRLMPTRAARGRIDCGGTRVVCMLALLVRGETSSAASSKPNVIMFTTDDQTVRDMAVMPKTQALIGNSGATFLHAYASDPLCCRPGSRSRPVSTPTTPASSAIPRHRADTAPSTTRTTYPCGCRPAATERSTSARCRTASVNPGLEAPPTFLRAGDRSPEGSDRPRRASSLRFHRAALLLHGVHSRPERVDKAYTADDYSTDVYSDLAVERINSPPVEFPQ